MTANAASAVRAARMFFEPDCLAAKAGLRAWVRVRSVIGVEWSVSEVGRVWIRLFVIMY